MCIVIGGLATSIFVARRKIVMLASCAKEDSNEARESTRAREDGVDDEESTPFEASIGCRGGIITDHRAYAPVRRTHAIA